MVEYPKPHNHRSTTAVTSTTTAVEDFPNTPLSPADDYYIDSNCSTPYVSAPSSPGRPMAGGGGFYYSAPASPMHFVLSSSSRSSAFLNGIPSPSGASSTGTSGSFEFEFSAMFGNAKDSSVLEIGSMSSADELFLNGQIRPMKLASHLQRPHFLSSLEDVAEAKNDGEYDGDERGVDKQVDDRGDGVFQRSRDLRLRDRSLRRRTRSLSPLRSTTSFDWGEIGTKGEEIVTVEKVTAKIEENAGGGAEAATAAAASASTETTPSASASSSRCSSAGRSSKRWVFLKDFLRSKSEGRNNVKFWTNISFSPGKEKKLSTSSASADDSKEKLSALPPMEGRKLKKTGKEPGKKSPASAKPAPMNGVGKRRVPPSAHELHYTVNRAQAEEMRKKTFLPYKQGLLGCLGFSSKSYGAINGFARALNPVSSR